MKFRLRTIYLMVVILLGISVQQSYGYIPSRQAKFITFSNVNETEMTINWVSGNGEEAIVLVKAGSAPTVSSLGDGSPIATANSVFTSAPEYPFASGNKLVYDGPGNSVTITGLTHSTTYYIMVLEYNNDGSTWDINNGTAVLNPRSKTTLQGTLTPPSGLSTIALTQTTATVQWTTDGLLADGYYIDVRRNEGAILPAYDLLDIGLPTSKNFFITGLTGSTAYEWRLRPYDAQGRVGAATTWQPFTTLQTDPSVTITGAGSACAATASLIATWQTSTYYPQPATGTWTTLFYPTGASLPNSGAPNVVSAAGTSTWNVEVDTPGEYVFQYEISVGEYYSSTTAGYTFSAPWTNIITSSTSTCGEYIALSAETTGCAIGTGTWSYTGPGTGAFTSTSALSTEFELTGVTPTYGNYTFRWTSTNGGFTTYDELIVNFAEEPTAFVTDASVGTCGLGIILTGNEPTVGTGTWFQVEPIEGGVATFANPNLYNTSVLVDESGYYSFIWMVGSACSTVGDSKHVTFYANPTDPEVGQSTSTCGTGFYLTGNEALAGVGTWTVSPSGPTIDDINYENSLVTVPAITGPSGYAEYTFTWSIGNGVCDTEWDELTVTFYGQPVVDITTPSEATCGLSIQLDADEPAFGTGSWWLVSGPGTVEEWSNQSAYNSTVTVSQAGEYSFAWTILNGDCEAVPAGKTVTFYAEPDLADAGNPTSTCGLVYTLSGNDPTSGTSEGTWSGPVGSFSDVNAYNSTVTIPSFSGSSTYHTFTWSIGNGICDPETDDVTITFYNAPTTASAGSDVNSCGTLTGTFAGNTPLVGEGSWTMVSGAGNPSINNTSSPTSTFVVPAYGTYTFRWSIANGNCTTSTDDVVYNFYQTPVASVGSDFAVCSTQATLTGNNPSVGTGTWTVPSGVSLSSNTAYNAVATAAPGNYTMTWSVSNGTCDVVFDELTVSFKESPVAYAGENGESCTGLDEEDLYTMNGSGTGTWSQSSGPGTASFYPNATTNNANVVFPESGVYVFTWTETNGTCTDTDEVTITVYDPIAIPLGAAISGDDTPAAGTNNIQYSIPNFNDDLSYSWYYTPSSTCGSAGTIPVINNDEENVVYLDYALTDCDGTLSVTLTDKCGNPSTFTLEIDVQNIPVITGATLESNTTLVVNTNFAIFTNCSTGVVTPADFQLFFNKNAGTATGATITSITGTNPYTFTISVTGTPNGCETIEVKPVANQVFSGGCTAMGNSQTTGQLSLFNMTSPDVASFVGISAYAKQATIAWTAPTGAKSLVVVNEDGIFNDPSNYTIYPADASYGTETYNPGNGYTVFNGTGNTVTVVGLDPETDYSVAIWTYTEACGDNNEYFNMTETTSTFGTKKLATKLVAVAPPTKITSGTPFNLTVQAVDDNDDPAYPGCDETLYLTGSAALATTTLELTGTTATFGNVVFDDGNGDCAHVFTFDDDDINCSYNLTSGTFTADVAPTEPTGHAKTLIFSGVQQNQITVTWTNGTGTGRVLGVRKGATLPLNEFVDGEGFSMVTTSTTATFGQGKELISDATNPAWAVHRTTSNAAVTVTGLVAGQSYNFRVVEYNKPECDLNWSLANFKNSGTAILNPRSISTLAKLGSFNGVEIAYFDGKSYQLQVDLNWEAITEDGIAYYEIYRQDMNSEDMIKVGSANVNVSAGAGSKYTVTDDKGLALGETYVYRLVGVDFNGQTTDLAETLVTVNDDVNRNVNLTIGSVNPNPVKDVVRFDVSTTQLSPVYIEIRNVEGKVIYTEERMVNGVSTIEYKMNVKAAGSYFITVTSGDEGAVTSFIYQP